MPFRTNAFLTPLQKKPANQTLKPFNINPSPLASTALNFGSKTSTPSNIPVSPMASVNRSVYTANQSFPMSKASPVDLGNVPLPQSTAPAVTPRRPAPAQQAALASTAVAPPVTPAPTATAAVGATPTPAPTPAPTVQAPQQLTELQKRILGTYTPTPQETALQGQIGGITSQQQALNASEAMGLARESTDPVAMNFITGRQSVIQRQAAAQQQGLSAQQQPLLQRLALAQAEREGLRDQATTELGFREPEIQKVGDYLVQKDPATGEYKTVFSPPTEAISAKDKLEQDKLTAEIALLKKDLTSTGDETERQLKLVELQTAQAKLKALTGGSDAPSYGEERKQLAINKIDNLVGQVNGFTTGLTGQIMSKIGGTDAFDLQAKLDALGSNLAFSELQAMRDASKTGGALGQVSERELALLEGALGSLNIGQSKEQLLGQLDQIKNSITRWANAVEKNRAESGGGDALDSVLDSVFGTTSPSNDLGTSLNGQVSIPDLMQPNGQQQLAKLNNNPGNLRFVGQAGARQGTGGFAQFDSPEAGFEALKGQVRYDMNNGLNLEQFINKYAPPVENDTNSYLQTLVMATGASPNTPLSQIDVNTLARAIAQRESGTTIA
jgi:hypothetical protein